MFTSEKHNYEIDRELKAEIQDKIHRKIKRECKYDCKEASAIESNLKKICSDCDIFKDVVSNDTRNEQFSRLLHEELHFIQPCMRTRVFSRILHFVHTIRNVHSSEIDLTESEKWNGEVS